MLKLASIMAHYSSNNKQSFTYFLVVLSIFLPCGDEIGFLEGEKNSYQLLRASMAFLFSRKQVTDKKKKERHQGCDYMTKPWLRKHGPNPLQLTSQVA